MGQDILAASGEMKPALILLQNTWSALRVVNDTANLVYVEFRAQVRRRLQPQAERRQVAKPLACKHHHDLQGSPLAPASTNWTELYDITADPWQATNL